MQSTISYRGDSRGEPEAINLEWPTLTGYLETTPIHTNSSSTVSVSGSDTSHIEPDTIDPEWPICTGYLDTTLAIFKRHKHPFILISTLANRWSGANNLDQDEIDILVRSSQTDAIVQDLVASGEWKLSTNYAHSQGDNFEPSMINCSQSRDTWLEACIEDPWFHYLRLWPEELYKLPIDCGKIEVPDVQNTQTVSLEEEYFRDPHSRFGPARLSKVDRSPVPGCKCAPNFCRWTSRSLYQRLKIISTHTWISEGRKLTLDFLTVACLNGRFTISFGTCISIGHPPASG